MNRFRHEKSEALTPSSRNRRALQALTFLLLSAAAMRLGSPVLQAKLDYDLTRAIESVRVAHAEARTVAARTGLPTRLIVDGDRGRVTVVGDGPPIGARSVILELGVPLGVGVASDVYELCFDGKGKPALAGGCEQHLGSIGIATPSGDAMLTLTPDGQLLLSGRTPPIS